MTTNKPQAQTKLPEPIALVVNNNQLGWSNIVETKPHVTLDIGLELYTRKQLEDALTLQAQEHAEELEKVKNPEIIKELRLSYREDGTRMFNSMPDYEYLKIEAINRVADALEALTEKSEGEEQA